MKKNKHKSKNKTNTTTTNDNKVENDNRKTIPGYKLLGMVGGAMALAGGYLWKQSGKINTKASVNTNTDLCAKYKIGDQYNGAIGNTTDIDYMNDNTTIFRKGCTYRGAIINDFFFPHRDTTLVDLNFDIHPMISQPQKMYNFQGEEHHRYTQCSTTPTKNYRLSKNDIASCTIKKVNVMQDGKNKTALLFHLSDSDKQRIIDSYNKGIDDAIECTKNDPSIRTFAVKYVNHRTPNGVYDFNLVPSDFKDKFANMMKLNKNIYISEFSCYYSDDFPSMISELLRENPNYQGSFVLRRNRSYDKIVTGHIESGLLHYTNGNKEFSFNEVMENPEYLVFNKKEKKCITENEARKILGGSFLYNLAYNKMNKFGDKEPTKQCKASLDKYQQCYNEFNTYQTCDPLLDDVILNKEKLNQLSQGDNFLSDVE